MRLNVLNNLCKSPQSGKRFRINTIEKCVRSHVPHMYLDDTLEQFFDSCRDPYAEIEEFQRIEVEFLLSSESPP